MYPIISPIVYNKNWQHLLLHIIYCNWKIEIEEKLYVWWGLHSLMFNSEHVYVYVLRQKCLYAGPPHLLCSWVEHISLWKNNHCIGETNYLFSFNVVDISHFSDFLWEMGCEEVEKGVCSMTIILCCWMTAKDILFVFYYLDLLALII